MTTPQTTQNPNCYHRLLESAAKIAHVLLTTQDLDLALSQALARLGGATGASTLTLYERLSPSDDAQEMLIRIHHIWERTDRPSDEEPLPPGAEAMPVPAGWRGSLETKGVIYDDESTLVLSIQHDDEIWGFLQITSDRPGHRWEEAEIDALKTIAGILGGAMLRHRQEIQLRRAAEGAEEKERLLREIHHRVKNNLAVVSSLLGLQAMQLQDPAVEAALEASRYRIHAMAHIHQHLHRSPDLTRVAMDGYIRQLANELKSVYGPSDVDIEIDSAPLLLNIDQAMPLGLILNELLSNALHHAFPPTREPAAPQPYINIILRSENGVGELIVTDNGIGLPPNLDVKSTNSLGLYLVNLLGNQLHGDLEVTGEGGTTISISFALDDQA
jgi:two-component sensor histidine kinase